MHHSFTCLMYSHRKTVSWKLLVLTVFIVAFFKTCISIFLTNRAQLQQAVIAGEEVFIQPGMYEEAKW